MMPLMCYSFTTAAISVVLSTSYVRGSCRVCVVGQRGHTRRGQDRRRKNTINNTAPLPVTGGQPEDSRIWAGSGPHPFHCLLLSGDPSPVSTSDGRQEGWSFDGNVTPSFLIENHYLLKTMTLRTTDAHVQGRCKQKKTTT